MGSSCKYGYLSGACANKHVDSLQCIGEDKCEFAYENVMTAIKAGHGAEGRGPERWLGLYCEKHGRFHCPGGDDCVKAGGNIARPFGRKNIIPEPDREP